LIPVFKPTHDETELRYLREVIESGWWGMGPKTARFEELFATFVGVKHAVGVSSATAALHLAMKVVGIEGREVITTPMTFVSTNHAILYNGGIPMFCDIEEDTLNLDVTKVEELVTPRTKAIVCVHYGGHACDMDALMDIAGRHKLAVIEDSAHGSGGRYRGRMLGSIGDLGCFSFHAVKNIATGDGGMVTLNDDDCDRRLRELRWLGITKDTFERDSGGRYSWYYNAIDLGYKYQMNDIMAALGLAQLEKLAKTNARRAEIARFYMRELAGVGDIRLPAFRPYAESAHHNFVIRTGHRGALNEYLKEQGIATSVHYYPNHLYEMYRSYYRELPVTERVWKQLLTLPLFPDLTDEEAETVTGRIREFFAMNLAEPPPPEDPTVT
jgi:perosamine synthetase